MFKQLDVIGQDRSFMKLKIKGRKKQHVKMLLFLCQDIFCLCNQNNLFFFSEILISSTSSLTERGTRYMLKLVKNEAWQHNVLECPLLF